MFFKNASGQVANNVHKQAWLTRKAVFKRVKTQPLDFEACSLLSLTIQIKKKRFLIPLIFNHTASARTPETIMTPKHFNLSLHYYYTVFLLM